jgi:hypothetical protein
MSKKISRKKVETKQRLNFDFIYNPKPNIKLIIYTTIALFSLGLSYYYVYFAFTLNHTYGFPLDDTWIHLTFARNLAEYHSFSYFKNEIVTAGSTSPVYTFLLAAGFIISKNEMLLSYILGILFLVLSAFFFYRISTFEFRKENVYALFITSIFIVDKWMNFISVSGMETTMFIFILLGCAYYYRQRKAIPFAVFLGLIIWTRPDGIAFIGALAVDYFIFIKFSQKKENLFTKNDFAKIGIVAGIIIIIYFIFNFFLSGSLLPNTYVAKLTYYSPEFRSRTEFLKTEVWNYFTKGSYSLILAGFAVSFIFLLSDLIKKKYNPNLLYILFTVFLVFIYWYKLPYAHKFGRYLMPIIPFMILVSGTGFRDLAKLFGRYMKNRKAAIVTFIFITGIILAWSFVNYNDNKNYYAERCTYIYDRYRTAADWIKENTNENDIIATHDVGVIGYYSGRKIIDVAGLITPELIGKLNDNNYSVIMTDYMKDKGVSYLAFLTEWYRVVNQNPLFSTADSLPPEVMEIYKFIPEKTYMISRYANSRVMDAQNALSQKQYQVAVQKLNQILQTENKASLVYLLLAISYMHLNDKINYEKNIQKALEIFPEYKDALLQYGYYKKTAGDFANAKVYLEKYLSVTPSDSKVKGILKSVDDSLKVK